MPSGWSVYYVVFLSAFLALGIPATLAVISYIISPQIKGRKPAPQPKGFNAVLADSHEANRTVLARKLNARFFLAANAALILIALMLVLIPCVGMLHASNVPGDLEGVPLRALIAVVTVAVLAALGLLYSARKSDLGWLKNYQKGRVHESGE